MQTTRDSITKIVFIYFYVLNISKIKDCVYVSWYYNYIKQYLRDDMKPNHLITF